MVTIVLFVVGIGLLVLGAEWLVRGSSQLAVVVGISPLVIGLTVVAFGTSAPELAVSVRAAWAGNSDIAFGNVVGSNICNVLLLLGLSALIAPLVVAQQLIRLDVPIMIGASLLLYGLAFDGLIGRWDGLLLFGGILAYTAFAVVKGRQEQQVAVRDEYDQAFGVTPRPTGGRAVMRNLAMVLVGLGMLVMGARWLVDAAVAVAHWLGVSELIIGLSIVAVGTSLPEIATSIIATLRGERDIAVGNVVGSNLFNILCVLGLASLVSPAGVAVAAEALRFDLLVMIGAAIACLPIFFTGNRIARWEGALFFGYYLAYLTYLILEAMHHPALPGFNLALLGFVLPLTVVTLTVSVWRAKQASWKRA
ncbi:MAG: calcium/sodium antiporter [Gammaproteobacteria bacterium]